MLGSALALGGAEVVVRAVDLDARWLPDLAYYQSVDVAVHQHAGDGLSYDLAPDARALYRKADDEPWGSDPRVISINSLGFRDPARTGRRALRVLAVGGSNTYGAAVTDGATWPAQTERALKGAGVDAEVWNLGVSGYVTRQKLAMARRALQHDPDLLLFQMSNTGPRNVLLTEDLDLLARYREDPSLWRESVIACPPEGTLRYALFRSSALVRGLALFRDRRARRKPPGVSFQPPSPELDDRAEEQAAAEFSAFLAELATTHPDVEVALMFPAEGGGAAWLNELALPVLDLHRAEPKPDLPDAEHIHPGEAVYRWYGDRLAEAIGAACRLDCDWESLELPWVYRADRAPRDPSDPVD